VRIARKGDSPVKRRSGRGKKGVIRASRYAFEGRVTTMQTDNIHLVSARANNERLAI
jgi:hypothetical protein